MCQSLLGGREDLTDNCSEDVLLESYVKSLNDCTLSDRSGPLSVYCDVCTQLMLSLTYCYVYLTNVIQYLMIVYFVK
jgi:hypothetical protein